LLVFRGVSARSGNKHELSMIDPALDKLYNNRAAVPEHADIFARWRRQSEAFVATQGGGRNLPYGTEPLQRLDLYPAPASRGLLVFIHGGYWRSLDKDDFSFIAAPYLQAGISVANFNYRLCPAVSIADIVQDCQTAIHWLAAHAPAHGVTFSNVVLAGHSAGGHLVSMLCATDWQARGISPSAFRGALAISGLYDLEPLRHVSVNVDLKLDPRSARELSPIRHAPVLNVPIRLVVGAAETSEFIRQTHLLSHAWPQRCGPVREIAGVNHFTIVDACFAADSAVLRDSLTLFPSA
jgi:arylformamidase